MRHYVWILYILSNALKRSIKSPLKVKKQKEQKVSIRVTIQQQFVTLVNLFPTEFPNFLFFIMLDFSVFDDHSKLISNSLSSHVCASMKATLCKHACVKVTIINLFRGINRTSRQSLAGQQRWDSPDTVEDTKEVKARL